MHSPLLYMCRSFLLAVTFSCVFHLSLDDFSNFMSVCSKSDAVFLRFGLGLGFVPVKNCIIVRKFSQLP